MEHGLPHQYQPSIHFIQEKIWDVMCKYFQYFFNFYKRGYAILISQNGKTLEQAVGSLMLRTCVVGDVVDAVGYPVDNFGGERMVHSKGPITEVDRSERPNPIGLPSNMTSGSSGGRLYFFILRIFNPIFSLDL